MNISQTIKTSNHRQIFYKKTILLSLFFYAASLANDIENQLNNQVIIGILAQFPYKDPHQYIAASYVKFVESAGARVVPIFLDRPFEYYDSLIRKINGVLIPGGGSPLDHGSYANAVNTVLNLSIQLNENGTYFPVWATCLSFEKIIVYFLNGELSWKTMCHVENISLNLKIEPSVLKNPSLTRMFKNMNDSVPNILKILQTQNVTANYHRVCIEVNEWKKHKELTNNFILISYNNYGNYTFVSTIEHQRYPIYASIWHPEKNQFEFVINAHVGNINHNKWAILTSQYFANFFINEARKNCGHFANKLEESEHLIYNYNQYRKYTGKNPKSSYEEIYEFPEKFNGQQGSKHYLQIWSLFTPLFILIQASLQIIE